MGRQNGKMGNNFMKNQDRVNHKPAFLKNLKKNKETNHVINKFSQSTVGDREDKNNTMEFPLTRENTFQNKMNKNSTILSHQVLHQNQNFRSREKDLKDMDVVSYKSGRNQERPSNSPDKKMGKPEVWQTTSNFHQRVPNYIELNKNKQNFMSNTNMKSPQNEPYKFYAPVQIIAPTVYFNSPKNNIKNPITPTINLFNV